MFIAEKTDGFYKNCTTEPQKREPQGCKANKRRRMLNALALADAQAGGHALGRGRLGFTRKTERLLVGVGRVGGVGGGRGLIIVLRLAHHRIVIVHGGGLRGMRASQREKSTRTEQSTRIERRSRNVRSTTEGTSPVVHLSKQQSQQSAW